MIRFGKIIATKLGARARTLIANVVGFGNEGSDDDAESLDETEVLQPLGLFARPVLSSKLEALILELGEDIVAAFMGDKGRGVFADVEEGETRVYSANDATCRVRFRADGSIDVEAKSAKSIRVTTSGGGNVVLNGGTLDVARKTDPVAGGTLYFVPGTGGATLAYVAPGGAPRPGTAIPLSGFTIDGGNATVKA